MCRSPMKQQTTLHFQFSDMLFPLIKTDVKKNKGRQKEPTQLGLGDVQHVWEDNLAIFRFKALHVT